MTLLAIVLAFQVAEPAPQVLRLRFEVENRSKTLVEGATLAVRLPVAEVLTGARASRPMRQETAPDGTVVGVVDLPDLPPYGRAVVTVTALVRDAESPSPEDDAWRAPVSDHSGIREVAKSTGGRVEGIYRWVRANLEDTGPTARDRGLDWALRARRGDCTEMAHVVVAIARAAGLPARLVGGYRVEGPTILDPSAYHNWAEVFDGRWRLVDPQAGVLDDAPTRYVAFERGAPPAAGPLAGRHRFAVDHEALTARMVEAP